MGIYSTIDYVESLGEADGLQDGVRAGASRQLSKLITGRAQGVRQGMAEGTRRWVLTIGRRRLGEPSKNLLHALQSLTEVERFDQIASRELTSDSWQEVMASH